MNNELTHGASAFLLAKYSEKTPEVNAIKAVLCVASDNLNVWST